MPNTSNKEVIVFGQVDGSSAPYQMSSHDFEVLGTKVLTQLGKRVRDFRYMEQMFRLRCMVQSELAAFFVLEELSILITTIRGEELIEHLKQMYVALKSQAYTTLRVVAEFQ